MARKPLNLSEKEMREHKKVLHTKNARKRREKVRVEGYIRLIEAVLALDKDKTLSLEQKALKMAKNKHFRVIYKPKIG